MPARLLACLPVSYTDRPTYRQADILCLPVCMSVCRPREHMGGPRRKTIIHTGNLYNSKPRSSLHCDVSSDAQGCAVVARRDARALSLDQRRPIRSKTERLEQTTTHIDNRECVYYIYISICISCV